MPAENFTPSEEPTGLESVPGYWRGRAAIRMQVAAEIQAAMGMTITDLRRASPSTPDTSLAHMIPLSARDLSTASMQRELQRNLALAREYERRAEDAARAA